MIIRLTINGEDKQFDCHPGALLLELLRDNGLHSVKYSDEHGDAGNDAVLVDGKLINSGIMLAAQAHGRKVVTVEALGTPERMHPIQEAFVETGAIQCGYCSPAMILSAYELIQRSPEPTDEEIKDALGGILCRCTGYAKPIEAIRLAATRMKHGLAGSAK